MHSIKISDGFLILKEFGFPWLVCRSLYAAKLRLLRFVPASEAIFEKHVSVKRILHIPLDTEGLEVFLSGLSQEKKDSIVEIANDALQGRIWGFSSVVLDYGYPIQWDKNPLTGQSARIDKKWFCIPDFDPARGDIKVIWEASRFTHFYFLARAYMITKDKKYYAGFSDQLGQWLEYNPYGYGPNYKCGQECALRMVNGLMAYVVFDCYGLTTDEDTKNIKELVFRCYKKILSNFFYAHRCIKNNHTLSELCGMIVGAWCCQDEKRLKRAYRWLNQEVRQQFQRDGGYRQYSFTYQRFALQLMEFIMKIAPVTGFSLETESKNRVLKSAEMLFQVQNEQGDVPNYGANDGALIFPVYAGSYRDFRPVVGGVFRCICGASPYPGGDYDEETIWFSDKARPMERKVLHRVSVSYPESGYYIIRDEGVMAAIIAQNYTSRPGQMDQFHIDMWVDGINILCDSGTYSYAEELGKELSLTGGHNTAKAENAEQMLTLGKFLTYGRPIVTILESDEKRISARMQSRNGYTHQRTVEYDGKGFNIYDQIMEKKNYTIVFHTPCEVLVDENRINLLWDGKKLAEITGDYGSVEVKPCYRSLYYFQKDRISKFILSPKGVGMPVSTKIKVRT